jgi:AcrR family transcriptional regulator
MDGRSVSRSLGGAEGEVRETVSLRSQLKQLTRDRLISCAVELFAEKGYRGTSVADIAAAAGTTATTFYRYFPTKSDVARLLQDRITVEVEKTLDALDKVKKPTRAALRDWLDKYGEMWQRMHILCNAYWEATATDPKLAAELVPSTERLTASMKLVQAVPEGKARDKFQARLVLMYLLMDRLFYLAHIQGHDPKAKRMLDEFSKILWESLFADAVEAAPGRAKASKA